MGVGVAFLSFFTSLFIQKRKDEEEKKGGVSDGGEADFQTQPPTLITYPRFFSFYFDYIYIKDGWSRFFQSGWHCIGEHR